jgi:nucleoside-diphosphate-sugar epimerase
MIDEETFAALKAPVLVLGATSLIGRFAWPRLVRARVAATALSRTADGAPGWLRADLAEPDLAARLPLSPTVLSLPPIWHLPQALGALQARGMRRLVAFSSTSALTKAASPDARERAIARRLAEAEAATQAFCAAHGVAWTILRPTLIYAEGQDRNVSRLAGMARRLGFLPLAGGGAGLRQPVHADDLAQGAIAAAVSAAAFDRAYDLPGGETLTYRQMAERVFEGMGRRPRIVCPPDAVWRLAFTLARPFLPGATAQMGARMAADLAFDPAPAARDFGWAPRPFRPDFQTSSSLGARRASRGSSPLDLDAAQ